MDFGELVRNLGIENCCDGMYYIVFHQVYVSNCFFSLSETVLKAILQFQFNVVTNAANKKNANFIFEMKNEYSALTENNDISCNNS